MSAAEITCVCGWKIRIEGGPDSFRSCYLMAQDAFLNHANGCRKHLSGNKRFPCPEKEAKKPTQ